MNRINRVTELAYKYSSLFLKAVANGLVQTVQWNANKLALEQTALEPALNPVIATERTKTTSKGIRLGGKKRTKK